MTESPPDPAKVQTAELRAVLGRWLRPPAEFSLRILGILAGWLWGAASSHRLRRIVLMAGFAGAILVVGKGVPVVYGRLALANAAATAAQQSLVQGMEQVQHTLNREAFLLGFPEASTQPESFKVETSFEEGLTLCSVSYDFVHVLDFYGMVQVPVRIRAKVVRMAVEPAPSATTAVD